MKIALIITHWNNSNDLIKCLKSIQKASAVPGLIYIVDNNSHISHLKNLNLFLKNYSHIKLIQNKQNFGVPKSWNIGIKNALQQKIDFVWILNADTTVSKEALSSLIKTYKSLKAPIIGSHMFFESKKDLIQDKASISFSKWKGYGKNKKFLDKLTQPYECYYISGCSMFLHANCFKNIGLFNEDLFFLGDEIDYCLRAKKLNIKIFCDPSSVIYHEGSASVPKKTPLRKYYETRNALYNVKNFFSNYIIISIFYHFFRILILDLIFRNQGTKQFQASFEGLLDFLKNKKGKWSKQDLLIIN